MEQSLMLVMVQRQIKRIPRNKIYQKWKIFLKQIVQGKYTHGYGN